jgi:hypothetical protein
MPNMKESTNKFSNAPEMENSSPMAMYGKSPMSMDGKSNSPMAMKGSWMSKHCSK